MKVHYYSISERGAKGFEGINLNDADAETFRKNPQIAEHVYSLTTLYPHSDGQLYIGASNMNGNILWRFDPDHKSFEDLEYSVLATPYDVKIHRSLVYDVKKDCFYGVSSGLHLENEYNDAPGASIFQYDINDRQYHSLGIPLPHEYTQTIAFDCQRRLIYGFTYHTFAFYVFDVDKRETIYNALPGSISHISAIDDAGCIWSTWGRNTHYLFKYDPNSNRIVWSRNKFPEGGQSYMYPGAGPIDCMVNGSDGYLYVALETGSLVRIDPDTCDIDYLGRPSPYPRIPAVIIGQDGLLYGVCGDDWQVKVFTFDRKTHGFEIIGDIACDKERCFRPHDMAILGNKIYVGETDNPNRCGFLWECHL